VKPFRIIVAGYGTVARALLDMLVTQERHLAEVHDVRLVPVAVVRAAGAWVDPEGLQLDRLAPRALMRKDVAEVLENVQAEALVELTPTDLKTGGVALDHVRSAIAKGLHVVTANKGPVVHAAPELEALAAKKGGSFRYEATVGAAIPLLSLRASLLGDRIERIDGVLNGTSNYILSRMGEEGLGFNEALEEAQGRGYAEADPAADVDGLDAAAKITILANRYLGLGARLEDVRVEGIRKVTGEAVQLAVKQGYVVRLVASASQAAGVTVAPRLVPLASPLNVQGTLNVVRFAREYGGPVSLTGHGAGGRETAAAVLADLLAAAGVAPR
jgi:homoserine dehydrogenase